MYAVLSSPFVQVFAGRAVAACRPFWRCLLSRFSPIARLTSAVLSVPFVIFRGFADDAVGGHLSVPCVGVFADRASDVCRPSSDGIDRGEGTRSGSACSVTGLETISPLQAACVPSCTPCFPSDGGERSTARASREK